MRFTHKDGDLATVEGQKKLWDLLQRTQPRNVWMARECKAWCAWTAFNASRSTQAAERIHRMREADQTHLRLCARVCKWQVAQGRRFHLEQPELSRVLSEEALRPVMSSTNKVLADMCAFGLRTPVSQRLIRKRTAIMTSCPKLAESLKLSQYPGNHSHQQIAGQLTLRDGRRVAVSQYASSYCRGFALHVCRCLLEDSACAAEGAKTPFRRRVRFKGPDGFPNKRSPEGSAQKRWWQYTRPSTASHPSRDHCSVGR